MSPETFHDLLDEATRGVVPAPPHHGSELEAGRTLLRRRRAVTGGALLATAAVAIIAVGSALAGPPSAADDPSRFATDPPSASSPSQDVPTVLSDVVDAAFPTPGAAQLRNIRVQTFLRGWGIERCGGRAAPLDSTADRFEQDVLPNLDLIRVRGFTEPSQESFKGADKNCQSGDLLRAAAPAWQAWAELTGPWLDLVDDTLLDDRLETLEAPMAECLRRATDLGIDDDDPVGSFFDTVGGDADAEVIRQGAVAFADCGADYFGTLERLLLAERTAYVEQHRELLQDFARQLGDLGYVP